MYKMFFPSGNAEEFCDHVFRTFDMDKNGYIDFKVSAHLSLLPFFRYRILINSLSREKNSPLPQSKAASQKSFTRR